MIIYCLDMRVKLIEFYLESSICAGLRDYQNLVFSFRDQRKTLLYLGSLVREWVFKWVKLILSTIFIERRDNLRFNHLKRIDTNILFASY